MITQHPDIEQLNSYLDGACEPVEQSTIREHLAGCAACQVELHELGVVRDAYRYLGKVDAPRSFALTREMADVATPLASPIAPAPTRIRRIEEITRIVAIAAVLAFLVLGTAQLAGLTDTTDPTYNSTFPVRTETNEGDGASQDQEPALARGEVREQGDAAAIGVNALAAEHALDDTPAQATNTGLTPLDFTLIGIGVTAIASSACWGLLHYRAGQPS